MNSNELNAVSELIWSTLNTIENSNKTREEQISLIKTIILTHAMEQRTIGRNQILNHLQDEINSLR